MTFRTHPRLALSEAPAATVETAEADAPNYREGMTGQGAARCVDCRFGGYNERCTLYQFSAPSYRAWWVCDAFEACPSMMFAERMPVTLADVGAKEADGTVWIEIAKVGTFYPKRRGGTAASGQTAINLTDDLLASIQRGTEKVLAEGRYPTGIPVRLDPVHGDKTKPAVGRIRETRLSEIDGVTRLLARVAWTDEGARLIEAGEYDACSLEADPPSIAQSKTTGELLGDWALTGLVITNDPFIPGLSALAASEAGETTPVKETKMDILKLLAGPLALTDSEPTEAQVLAAVTALSEKAAKADALKEALETTAADRDKLKEANAELSEWKTKTMLDAACADGRIDASERDRYARAVLALGEEEAQAIFPADRVKTAPKSTQHEKQPESGGGASVSLADIEGKVANRAKEIEETRGMDGATAYSTAMSEVLSDPNHAAAYANATGFTHSA